MQRLEVEHVRLNTGIKKPLQYLIIHALCVHLKEMEALTIGQPVFFDLREPWLHAPG